MKKLSWCVLFISFISSAQDLPPLVQQQVEQAAAESENESTDDDQLLQDLALFKKNRINLNTAGEEDLIALHFLSPLQIQSFLQYRKILGLFLDLYELQAIPGWDLGTIKNIIQFVRVGAIKENMQQRFHGDQLLLLRIGRDVTSNKTDSNTQKFLGNPYQLQVRYRYQYTNTLYVGMVADKDPGELFFNGGQSKGFDFYSVHVFARHIGPIKSIALGDYCINLGQGLLAWQSYGPGKGGEVMNIKRQSPVLMPYRSAGEFNFNRGAALTLEKNRFELSAFISSKKISAGVDTGLVPQFTSIHTSGYHRTESEIAGRNQVRHSRMGGNIRYQWETGNLGWNGLLEHFSLPWQKEPAVYNRFSFGGRTLFLSSINCSQTFRNLHFFGEWATDKQAHTAIIAGGLISLGEKADLALLYRNCDKAFPSLFGNAFTENTLPVNENGWYAALCLRPGAQWQLDSYVDLFSSSWLRYRVNAPASGCEYLLRIQYQPDKKTTVYLRFRTKNKPLNGFADSMMNSPADQGRQSLRIHANYSVTRTFSLQNRVEMVWYRQHVQRNEQGFLAYTEGKYSLSAALSAIIRFQYFESGNYDSRIYAYESDLLYASSIPVFYDKGFRYYLLCQADLPPHLSFWLKWADTIKKDPAGLMPAEHTAFRIQMAYAF
jgi:hypothetical protein